MNRIFFIIIIIISNTFLSYSQVISQKIGNNPSIINPSAALEIESSSKGVLLPRVSLTSTTSTSPLTAHVSGMMVYNTATTSDVTPGVYTNNGTGWIRSEVSSSSGGIYSGNGSLQTGTTTVTQAGNKLAFVTDNSVSDAFSVDGSTLSVDALNDAVGIGTNAPLTSARLEVNSTTKGFLPPRMTMLQRDGIASPATGLIIWCTDCGTSGQIQVYNGSFWTDISGSPAASVIEVASINCSGATHNGRLISGAAASGVSSVIAYTGGNGGTYAAQSIASTGVTGLTATLTAGTLASGAGTLTYTITGTPSTNGLASFTINIGGQTCTLTRIVEGVITSLACSNAIHNGTLITNTPASGVSSVIAYTGGNGGTYETQSIASTGVTGLTATLTAGTISSGDGTLTFTITGTPSTAGTANFAITLGGQTCTLSQTVFIESSITGLNCGGATHNGILISSIEGTVTSDISYTGGNGGGYTEQSIASTGVTGLTASVSAGVLANGAGTLTYTITGTPSAVGTASFAITLGGQTCTFTRTVLPAATITALRCGSIINYSTYVGFLTSGLETPIAYSEVPYTGGNGGGYTEQSIASKGVTGLTARIPAGTLASGDGTLTYTITGIPSEEGTAIFTINLGGQTCTFFRRVLPQGIVTTIDCDGGTTSGELRSGSEASGVYSIIEYTGANGGTYAAQSIASTGVTGLTANISAGILANGAGTVTYNITGTPSGGGTASFAISIGGQTCTLTREVIAITSLNCGGATHNGSLTYNVEASGVSSVISYTGGDGSAHSGKTVASTGVTGLTATLAAGNFATGAGTVTYTITGTPSSGGIASFAINIGGQTCTLTREVAAIATLNCAGATHNGTLSYNVAASGVTSVIAYTGGDGSVHNGQTVTSTGVTGLTATLAAGNYATGNGTLTYTITGTPSRGGTASFTISIGGKTCTLTREVANIASLNCNIQQIGDLTYNVPASGVSLNISYTGGDGSAYSGQTITSTGVVTGLTATLAAGNFANGSGTLTYIVTGTPSRGGWANFNFNIGGKVCNFSMDVYPIATLDCANITLRGTLTAGIAASGVSFDIPYTGGDGVSYYFGFSRSTGVTGLEAQTSGSFSTMIFANGSGTLNFTITGTPSAAGTASFDIYLEGKTCTITVPVNPFIPSTYALDQNKVHFITSVYDQDYLPYTASGVAATTATQAADGLNEAKVIDFQGSITTEGVRVQIPMSSITFGSISSCTIPAYSSTITVPANMTQDGISRDLTMSWPQENFYSYSGNYIWASIKAVGGTLNLKKLDINAGIGNNALGVLIGQFTYPYNTAGNTTTLSLRAITPIPDKMFGLPDNSGNSTTHNMLYVPIMAEDGKIWLNNNLGANYSNMNHTSFDFNNKGERYLGNRDLNSEGSLFQWGRKPDGHELINYIDEYTATSVNGTTATKSNSPNHSLFITAGTTPYDWRTTQDDTLWATEASANNPCPKGFRVPTSTEIQNLLDNTTGDVRDSILVYYVSFCRFDDGRPFFYTVSPFWSSSVSGTQAKALSWENIDSLNRASALHVRCIKN